MNNSLEILLKTALITNKTLTNFIPSKNKPLPIIPFQNFLCPKLCGKRNRWV